MTTSPTAASVSRLSYSSTSAYLTCGRLWKFRYIDKIPVPTGARLLFGSAFHDVIEAHLRAIAEGRESPHLTEIWNRQWTRQLKREGDHVDWGDDTPEDLRLMGVRMLETPEVVETIEGISPLVSPYGHMYIEEWVKMKVPGVPVPIVGRIDIISDDGVPGDFKATSWPWSEEKARAELQPLFYLASLRQQGFPHNEEMRFRHYVFTTSEEPTSQVIETQRDADEIPFLFDLVREVWRGISAGVFVPNPNTWKCSLDYCEYWGICRGKALGEDG
jgi:hypothetical protein